MFLEEYLLPTHINILAVCNLQLEAVLRRLLWLKSKDPKVKVLVFSEWQGVLDVVEHALMANHITFARVKGGRCVFHISYDLQKYPHLSPDICDC